MNPFKGPRRKLAIVSTSVGALVATAGAAFAFITLNAAGTASASKAQVNPVTVSNIVVDPMLPGAPLSKVGFQMSNPNNFRVRLVSITRTSGFTVPAGETCQRDELVGPLSTAEPMTLPENLVLQRNAENVSIDAAEALGLAGSATSTCAVSFTVRVAAQQLGN